MKQLFSLEKDRNNTFNNACRDVAIDFQIDLDHCVIKWEMIEIDCKNCSKFRSQNSIITLLQLRLANPSRTRYLLDIYKTKSYLPETYLIDNYLVTYCHLLKISFLNI